MKRRPTEAVVDTGALRHNYLEIEKRLGPSSTVLAVVKADAYGHGDIPVSKTLEGLGCRHLGVAIPEEGAKLREAGIKAAIVVMGGFFPEQVEDLFEYDLTPAVFDLTGLKLIDSRARAGVSKKVHIKVDTGMGRLGFLPRELEASAGEIKGLRHVEVEAFFSHFAEADSPDKGFSKLQLERFLEAVERLRKAGIPAPLLHMANSAAAVDFPDSRLNLVRPGIMLYGSYPSRHLAEKINLRPVMELRTRILKLRGLPGGSSVSYGRTFVAKRDGIFAVLPIGYGDGLPRSLSGKGCVLVRGRRAPLAGVICMDLAICDVTGIPGVTEGDEVTVIGSQGRETITAEEVAEKAGTISYEVFCQISKRVPRVYI